MAGYNPVMNSMRTAPYGSWNSPITAELIATGSISLGQVALDGDDSYWSEMRPAENGRNVIVRCAANGNIEDILPPPFNARTRVHEYGGGAFTVADGTVFFSNDTDQCIYRLVPGREPAAITPAVDHRYADAVVDRRRERLICVREDHSRGGEPVNTIVDIDIEGARAPRVLVSGDDFYAAPRLSQDGGHLAWLSWRHPNMPWDGTVLWLAPVNADGSLGGAQRIAGGDDESILQPSFSPDGRLYFISDRTNWWNLYYWENGRVTVLTEQAAEFAQPPWIFGMSTSAFVSAECLVCAFSRDGIWSLARIDTRTCRFEVIDTPYTEIASVTAGGGKVLAVAGSPVEPSALVRIDSISGQRDVLRRSNRMEVDRDYLSAPEAITYPARGGETAHGFYYPPRNRYFVAPPGEKPPLLVFSHGGPTAASSNALNLKIQFWTSRGFAVLDVNYRGSTGYGRDYRRRLYGQWGIFDVDDCVHGARYLVAQGKADVQRLAIRGGSAGGYTTLCALTFHDVFKAGASYYGVSDLEALARETHKFEAHYLDRLVGPYPQQRALYRQRSPLHHSGRLACPVVFLQGQEDKVVPPAQAEQMVQALRARGLPVAYVAFPGEQHGFRRAGSIRRALECELSFYSQLFGFRPADEIDPLEIENLG